MPKYFANELGFVWPSIDHSMAGKMSITAGDRVFYYMTRDSLCFLTMAEARYPKRLAFLYLDEIGDLVLGEMVREFGNEVRDQSTKLLPSFFLLVEAPYRKGL